MTPHGFINDNDKELKGVIKMTEFPSIGRDILGGD